MKNEIFNFDTEYNSENEVKAAIAEALNYIDEPEEDKDAFVFITNTEQMKVMACAYKALKYLTKGTSVKVTYKFEDDRSYGYIFVRGKNIVFDKPDLFMSALKLGSNFEICFMADGSLQIGCMFCGLIKPL